MWFYSVRFGKGDPGGSVEHLVLQTTTTLLIDSYDDLLTLFLLLDARVVYSCSLTHWFTLFTLSAKGLTQGGNLAWFSICKQGMFTYHQTRVKPYSHRYMPKLSRPTPACCVAPMCALVDIWIKGRYCDISEVKIPALPMRSRKLFRDRDHHVTTS